MLMRKFAACYAQGKYGARLFRTYVQNVETREQFLQIVRDHFPLRDARGHGDDEKNSSQEHTLGVSSEQSIE
jgi:tRNA-dihydrouridine synthase B